MLHFVPYGVFVKQMKNVVKVCEISFSSPMGCLLNYPYDKKEDYSDGISSPMGNLLNVSCGKDSELEKALFRPLWGIC